MQDYHSLAVCLFTTTSTAKDPSINFHSTHNVPTYSVLYIHIFQPPPPPTPTTMISASMASAHPTMSTPTDTSRSTEELRLDDVQLVRSKCCSHLSDDTQLKEVKAENKMAYMYRARWEEPWFDHLSGLLKAFHVPSEVQFRQMAENLPLPPPDEEELWHESLLVALCLPLPEPSVDEEVLQDLERASCTPLPQGLELDELSEDTDVSSFAGSTSRPSTPDTEAMEYGPPQVFAHEGNNPAASKDKEMSDAGEDLPASSLGDVPMKEAPETLLAATAEDEVMSDAAEGPQPNSAEDEEMALAGDGGSDQESVSKEHDQDIVMEEVAVGKDLQGPSSCPSSGSPQSNREMEGVRSTSANLPPSMVQSAKTHQEGNATRVKIPPTSLIQANDLNGGVWKEMKDLCPDFHVDLRKKLDNSIEDEARACRDDSTEESTPVASTAEIFKYLKMPSKPSATTQGQDTPGSQNGTEATAQGMMDQTHLEPEEQIKRVLDIILKARQSFHAKSWAANFQRMFQLPWHDTQEMKKVAEFVIASRNWGQKDYRRAISALEGIFSGNEYATEMLIWHCNTFLHNKQIELRGSRVSYQQRLRTVREFFCELVGSNHKLVKAMNESSCMTWEEMRDLAESEDHEFFTSRSGSLTAINKFFYAEHMQKRKAYWSNLDNVRKHLAAQHPTPPQTVLAPQAPDGMQLTPAQKRSSKSSEYSQAKRAHTDEPDDKPASPARRIAGMKRSTAETGMYGFAPRDEPANRLLEASGATKTKRIRDKSNESACSDEAPR
ncbi:hypothetical protein EJ07DRAFT_153785 [Lizonia empirigonia]|nr:hypothetical protein EJ07DRAFT_153785 [Lizonia empirigonia]